MHSLVMNPCSCGLIVKRDKKFTFDLSNTGQRCTQNNIVAVAPGFSESDMWSDTYTNFEIKRRGGWQNIIDWDPYISRAKTMIP